MMRTWTKLHHQKGGAGGHLTHAAFLEHHSRHQPPLLKEQSQQKLYTGELFRAMQVAHSATAPSAENYQRRIGEAG